MPDTILSALPPLTHQTSTTTPCNRHYHCSHFTNEETDRQYYLVRGYTNNKWQRIRTEADATTAYMLNHSHACEFVLACGLYRMDTLDSFIYYRRNIDMCNKGSSN